MSDEELNVNYIREKTGLVENDELIPIILEMIKESYKSGLCQSEFDNTMGLIEENQELKMQLEDMTLCRDIASGHRKEVQDRETILLKENQDLKQKYLNAVADYEQEKFNVEELKKQLEDLLNGNRTLRKKLENCMTFEDYNHTLSEKIKLKNQQKEFIEYMESEKDRLARECSNIYEDSLGKTRLVNEDIFNEVDNNLSKYKEIIGGKDDI